MLRGKDLVAGLALVGALGLGAFLVLRSRGALGESWTDGLRHFGSETGAAVRHAVWDAPEAFPELGEVHDPTLSPDGRLLVFTSGERGLNCELFAAEMVDGVPRRPLPLARLNSPADELAPAFGAGSLWFASDREGGAGGLDLWRAPYADGLFGEPTPVGPGLNSAADECDPAPIPGSRALIFASNRARSDFDLYLAAPDASGFLTIDPLPRLNSAADEREPAVGSNGRILYFASDRAGDFGLYRSLRFADGWQDVGIPGGLEELPGARGPWPTADGFALLFEGRAADASGVLERARSLEIFRLPTALVTLGEWLTLAALVLLALLALLAKRWHALDILYRCVLVSLVLHLLLMLLLRQMVPEEQRYEVGPDDGPTFRVRLAPSENTGEELQARLGPNAPSTLERSDLAAASSAAATPEAQPLTAPERPAQQPPARAAEAGARRAEQSTPLALESREAALERAAAARPELTLQARAGAGPGRPETHSDAHSSGPVPAMLADARERARPGQARLQDARGSLLEATPGAAPRQRAPSAPTPIAVSLAAPAQASVHASGSAPALALQLLNTPGNSASAPPTTRSAPTRSPAPSSSVPRRPPSPSPGALLTHEGTHQGPGPAPRLVADAAPGGNTAPELRAAPAPKQPNGAQPDGAQHGGAHAPARAFDATAGLALAAGSERRDAPPALDGRTRARTGPTRARLGPTRARNGARPLEQPVRPHLEPLLAPLAKPQGAREPAPPRLAETPYQNRFGAQKLRALEEYGGNRETEVAVAAGLRYLARIQRSSGAWGSRSDAHSKYLDVRIGKSALALLAFLGAGHVPGGDGEHAGNARRAVRYLLGQQDERSGHFGRSGPYGHGIATYALAECFAMTGDEELRAPLERAVGQILRNQSKLDDPRFLGGWGYYFHDARVWNRDEWPRTSVTAWQVMALESARLGGLEVPARAFARARQFLLGAWDRRARAYRYSHDPARLSSGYPILPASTPAALFALTLLSVDPAGDDMAEARRFVLKRMPDGYRYTGGDDFVHRARGNLYFWYYSTLALFRVGGGPWEAWNAALKETLLPSQEEDGSWRPIDVYSEYAGDDDDERTYSTAMCVLSLEIYYRYFTPLLEVR